MNVLNIKNKTIERKGIRPKTVRGAVKRGVVGPDKGWSDAGRLLVARARDIEAKRAELERLNGTIETLETERAATKKKLVGVKPAAGLSVSPVSTSEPKTTETTEPSQDKRCFIDEHHCMRLP